MSDSPLSVLDRPNSYIGRSVPRPNARRLLAGRGRFVDDIKLPRMLHVAFVRSPHAHARIAGIDSATAAAMPGVVRVVEGRELAKVCTPWVGVLSHLEGLKSAPQQALAIDVACWQGEPVVAVLADTRAHAPSTSQGAPDARSRHSDSSRARCARRSAEAAAHASSSARSAGVASPARTRAIRASEG